VVVLAQSSRAPGVVSGHLSDQLVMEYIPQDATISVGDVVLTSGMGGSYPKSLVVGQVTEVEQRDIDTFQRAIVRPSVSFDELETVLVVTSFEPVDVDADTAGEEAAPAAGTPAVQTPAADETPEPAPRDAATQTPAP
jgi:rod shape-determining protein MreC